MTEGINVVNEKDGRVGVAEEYVYTTMFAYRFLKEPDAVRVRLGDAEETWMLKDCRPE